MKPFLTVASIILGSLGILSLIMFSLFNRGMGEIKKLVINEVDLSKVPDGTFRGTYRKGRWKYDVEVTIKDHRIVAVKSLDAGMNKLWADFNSKVETAILDRQSVGIDVVSGATITTKAMQKAVENALRGSVGHTP